MNDSEIKAESKTQVCVVGGGPAGIILAFMLASQGIKVRVLESQKDFDRDFRGDTLQPSALEILDDLGLMPTLLALPHTKKSGAIMGGDTLLDTASLKTRFPYAISVQQAQLLPELVRKAERFPHFSIEMGAKVVNLLKTENKVCGVEYTKAGQSHTLKADLIVGADGRFSTVRKLAGFQPIAKSSPMDILWFRIPRYTDDPAEIDGPNAPQRMLLFINRQDYWQVGYIFPKGTFKDIRAAGIEALKQEIIALRPQVSRQMGTLNDWKATSVLAVEINAVKTWHQDGLLLIGDAAHAMAPIGSVGMSYAIQDAVATAEVVVPKLRNNTLSRRDLAEVQKRRERPVKLMQSFQAMAQKMLFERTNSSSKSQQIRIPKPLTFLPKLLSWFIQLGPWRAQVKTLKQESFRL